MKKILFLLILFFVGQAFVLGQSTASKQVQTFTIEAPQLDSHKTIWVYLPKSYETSKETYPVIYMFDAQNLFDAKASYVGEWEIDEYLDKANQDVIVIGIEHGNEKRIEELTPYQNEKYGGGKGDLFIDFIRHTVKPHIDITFRTKSEAQHTTIFGSSLGGLMAFYAAIKYPETFGKAGIFSPAFWINPEIFNLASESQLNSRSEFYFMAGTEESETMVSNLEQMISIIKAQGIPSDHIQKKIVEGGKHNETLWKNNFPEACQWLLLQKSIKND
ncbi:alpha/beta hydrolase [Psychroserpens sp. XS_ASV72]|uniref:alpha/beta hydrolase n=1 Tax=Psychroserpens sp. XS_ASV72 TaxID=3241293 RepID=UPI00351648A2